jgi:hypothetical protein
MRWPAVIVLCLVPALAGAWPTTPDPCSREGESCTTNNGNATQYGTCVLKPECSKMPKDNLPSFCVACQVTEEWDTSGCGKSERGDVLAFAPLLVCFLVLRRARSL